MKPLKQLKEKGEIPKGNACIIALELENGCIVTSNEKDYAPIYRETGAGLTVIR